MVAGEDLVKVLSWRLEVEGNVSVRPFLRISERKDLREGETKAAAQ